MGSYLFISEKEVKGMINNISETIMGIYGKEEEIVLVGMIRGGFEITKLLESRLPNAIIIKYNSDETPQITEEDRNKIKGKECIVCDDSVVSGDTLNKACYVIKQYGAKEVKIVALVSRKGSKVIPHLYSIESDPKDVVVFPWKTPPLRNYLISGLGLIRSINDVEILEKTWGPLIKANNFRNVENYNKKGLIIDDSDGTTMGVVRFWVDNSEIIVEDLKVLLHPTNRLFDRILESLYNLIANYSHFHRKNKISFIVPKSETQRWKNRGLEVGQKCDIDGKTFVDVFLIGRRSL